MTVFRFSQEEFEQARGEDLVSCFCGFCGNGFKLKKHDLRQKTQRYKDFYCSPKCRDKSRVVSEIVECKLCNKGFRKKLSEIKRTQNSFCSRSCGATYQNTHKTKGTRRSKLEAWLEQKLPPLYPSIEFHFNRKDAIDSELDIYIPSLKLAFELNGIFHYEPIYGEKKLKQIKDNDSRKSQTCLDKRIELNIIDVSKLSHFNESSAIKFLQIIESVIRKKDGAVGEN